MSEHDFVPTGPESGRAECLCGCGSQATMMGIYKPEENLSSSPVNHDDSGALEKTKETVHALL